MIIDGKSMMITVYLFTLDKGFPTSLPLVSYYISISDNFDSPLTQSEMAITEHASVSTGTLTDLMRQAIRQFSLHRWPRRWN
jgi:hypothetical protein